MGGGEVIFSLLAPHTKIAPRCASTNIRLTAHLGLYVPTKQDDNGTNEQGMASSTSSQQRPPPKCGIRVRDKWYTWNVGKVLVFDDSYEHEVVNDTNECCAVLLI